MLLILMLVQEILFIINVLNSVLDLDIKSIVRFKQTSDWYVYEPYYLQQHLYFFEIWSYYW